MKVGSNTISTTYFSKDDWYDYIERNRDMFANHEYPVLFDAIDYKNTGVGFIKLPYKCLNEGD